jgi:hypothetical protein
MLVRKLNLQPQHLTPHPCILPEPTNLPFILFNFLYYLFYRSFTPFQKQHTPQQFNCSGKFNNVPVQYIYRNRFLIVPVFFFYYGRRRLLPEQRETVPVQFSIPEQIFNLFRCVKFSRHCYRITMKRVPVCIILQNLYRNVRASFPVCNIVQKLIPERNTRVPVWFINPVNRIMLFKCSGLIYFTNFFNNFMYFKQVWQVLKQALPIKLM